MNLLKAAQNFFIPQQIKPIQPLVPLTKPQIVALIPTWKPTQMSFDLVAYLIAWNPGIKVVVVDDHTPFELDSLSILGKLYDLAEDTKAIYLIHTPQNRLKAGALNYGLDYIEQQNLKPDVVITFDDDVTISSDTISTLANSLATNPQLAAVCTLAKIENKNANLLTRLEGLEYHNFNLIKQADNGFFQGPLVMPGMLTAFRYDAIRQIRGFTNGHLIEDYEITTRLKLAGWQVAIEPKAQAFTKVPTDLKALWKQRVRWSYWGLYVVRKNWRNAPVIIQDLIGHLMFTISTIFIMLSFLIPRQDSNSILVTVIIVVAAIQFIVSYFIHIASMFVYEERDGLDWFIRLTIIPEFIYSYLLSFLLVGSYLFFAYNAVWKRIVKKIPSSQRIYELGLRIFGQFGYSFTWGTKETNASQMVTREVNQIV